MADPDFLAEAKNLDIDIEPMGADETRPTVERLFATPPDAVARIEAALAQ